MPTFIFFQNAENETIYELLPWSFADEKLVRYVRQLARTLIAEACRKSRLLRYFQHRHRESASHSTLIQQQH